VTELGVSPSCFFAFSMGPMDRFAPPDPRSVSIVSPVKVDDDLVSPLSATAPLCWWAGLERFTPGLLALHIRDTAMRLRITPNGKK